jgi:hypothetical protein
VVRPRLMMYPAIRMRVRMAGAFDAKSENSPLLAMVVTEKLNRPDRVRSRDYNDETNSHIPKSQGRICKSNFLVTRLSITRSISY